MKPPCTRLREAAIFKATGRCTHTGHTQQDSEATILKRRTKYDSPFAPVSFPRKHRPREATTVTQVTKTEIQSLLWLDLEGKSDRMEPPKRNTKAVCTLPSRSWHVFKGQDCKKPGRKCNWEGKYMRRGSSTLLGSSNHGRTTDRPDSTRGTEADGGGVHKAWRDTVRASAGPEGSVGQQICLKNSQPPWVGISSDSPKVLF